MNNLETINVNKPLDLAEKASEFMYKARARVYSALILLEAPEANFESKGFKEDCLHYQLDDAYQLMKQYESLFDGAATELLQNRKKGAVEVLPENSAQGVFSQPQSLNQG